jgi:hypothetical protein
LLIHQLSLWKHQREAISKVLRYLAAFQRGDAEGAALIQMPTGAGKTGVIATLARCVPEIGCVLVIAPRVALRDQLWRDISGRFFDKLKRSPTTFPKRVIRLTGRQASLRNLSDTVFVSTIQKLESMRRRNEALYGQLQRQTSVLLFDEGHYEPAPVWREVVRTIRSPRVIFTATPYRNDLKLFDVDFKHVYSYTFGEALRDGFIRRVEIHQMPFTRSPQRFVEQVIGFYDEHLSGRARGGKQAPRVIIRCESAESIRQICAALRVRGRTCIGIHETFEDGPSDSAYERRSVPDPMTTDVTFWIHQFKLLEGIDDARFQLLALYDELHTVRALVQQVGRIVRNPEQRKGSVTYVLDHSGGRQASLWQNYLQYDEVLRTQGVDILARGQELMVNALRNAQPPVIYLEGRFRTPSNLETLDAWKDLQLPLTVNLLRKEAGFRLREAHEAVIRAHTEADRIVWSPTLDNGVGVAVYVAIRNSPLLREGAFLESRLGVTVLKELGDYICYFDSVGTPPPIVAGIGRPVPLKILRKLFQRREGCYLTSVALRNANLGAAMVRARSISAVDIDLTVPAFDDHAFVCSTAYGYSVRRASDRGASANRVRRYVGFGSGKVSDLIGKAVPFREFLAWLDEIREILRSSTESLPTFRRYASIAGPPADPTPNSVLLDLAEVRDRYVTAGGDGIPRDAPMEIDELCKEVENGQFSVVANGKECNVSIEFDAARQRYVLQSPELDGLYYSTDAQEREGLIQYVNRTQSIRVIPRSPGSFYTEGQFYRPLIRFGAEYDDRKMAVLASLVPIAALAAVGSEKGARCRTRGAGWESGCLFDLIDRLGRGTEMANYFEGAEILVCDDMGDEISDFILLQRLEGAGGRKRIAFIHLKARSEASLYSASDLQDVCGQAAKNLGELALFGDSRADKTRKWGRPWKSGQVQGYVARRIRLARRRGRVWEETRRVVRDPTGDREVWLVLGRILSKRRFEDELKKPQPQAAAVQAAYLLFSTLTTAAAAGARLRIFCSP